MLGSPRSLLPGQAGNQAQSSTLLEIDDSSDPYKPARFTNEAELQELVCNSAGRFFKVSNIIRPRKAAVA